MSCKVLSGLKMKHRYVLIYQASGQRTLILASCFVKDWLQLHYAHRIWRSGLVLWTSTSQTGQWYDVWRYLTIQLRQTRDKNRKKNLSDPTKLITVQKSRTCLNNIIFNFKFFFFHFLSNELEMLPSSDRLVCECTFLFGWFFCCCFLLLFFVHLLFLFVLLCFFFS